MDAASHIFRTLDALKNADPGVFHSGHRRVDDPSPADSRWHLQGTVPSSNRLYPQITSLFLQECSQLQSFEWVKSFPNLANLWIYGSDRISDLEGIQAAKGLKSLTIWPTMSATTTVDSLSPVSSLTQLEDLIYAGKTRDGSLAALHSLRNLKTAFFSNSYAWQEIARFEASHPYADFPWKGGVVPAANASVMKCKICGTPQSMLTGKGLRLACPKCDFSYIEKHLKRYTQLLTAEGSLRRYHSFPHPTHHRAE